MNRPTIAAMRGNPMLVVPLLALALLLSRSPPTPVEVAPRHPVSDHAATVLVTDLETAGSRLAEERGRAYVALHAGVALHRGERAAVDAARAASDAVLDDALARLETTIGSEHLAVARVRAWRERLAPLRAEVDRALAWPRRARDRGLASRWFRDTSDLIDGLYQAARFAGPWWADESGSRQDLVALQLNAWRISEITGRERAVVGAAIASGEPMDADARHTLARYQNRLAADWHRLEQLAAHSLRAAELEAGLERARRALFEDLARTRDRVLVAGAYGGTYPLTAEEWFSLVSRVIDSVLMLRRDAARLAQAPGTMASDRDTRAPRGGHAGGA